MNSIAGIDFGSMACRAAIFSGGDVEPFDHRFSAGRQPLLMENTAEAGAAAESPAIPVAFVSLKQKAGGEETISSRSGSRSIASAITEIFKQLREDMRVGLSDPIDGAVIAVPGFFPERPRSVLRQAALDAGFPGVKLFDEALAAIMGTSNLPQNGSVLFYSLGAGMFSASVVKIVGGKARVLSSEGDRFLGGFSFDAALAALMADRLGRSSAMPAASGPILKLRKYAEQLKIGLSKHESEDCEIDIFEVFGEQGLATVTVTRGDLEKLIRKTLEETVSQARKAVSDSGLIAGAIDLVLLSGGSTRVPLVEQLLACEFMVPVVRADDLAIARGAARQGAQLDASDWKRPEPVKREEPEQAPAVQQAALPAARTGTWVSMFAPYLQDAETLWKQGERDKAIGLIEEMMRQGKAYLGTLRHELGKSLFQDGRFEEALVVMERAVESSPTDKHALQTLHETMNQRARQLMASGRLTDARKMIREALRLDRRCPGCLQVEAMINTAWKDATVAKFKRKR